ncbi:MAG TPA: 2-iminoacetate synthase ThiH [Candidatus Hydrogenedentes bacterium]|nr:2-iminoacetate synthase ThiH [Candidatus Hydrogenedentota bacterium]HOL77300.1 2-iminoacetate synthase ThiH [Candidatus Hydrogenedentota bacterium]HPO85943.1 2-iminoacetate synthase ThiH [Candidatus Hydrogenedentota bacterium]
MSFASVLEYWSADRVRERISLSSERDVERALSKEELTETDVCALLSEAARPWLEAMAQLAHRRTRRFFGRTIGLYAPLYISNICGADCVYCGYAVRSGSKLKRLTLTEAEIRRECEALAARGFQHVLLLTGEAPRAVPVSYIEKAVSLAREYFASVSIEVYALDEDEYRRLVYAGLDGVTLYMETYDRETYARVHLKGRKRDYAYRLDAIERAGKAGVRRLSIGALLGLYDWRIDGFWAMLHARYLQKACWQSAISMSFPRLIHTPPRFRVVNPLSDRDLVQLMLAARLFLPEVGFNLSTRERASLRDRLIPLGVTMMSAGSSTRPGGYSTHGEETLEQFEIEDTRSPAEVAEAIRKAGYDPVWKDFDAAFVDDQVGWVGSCVEGSTDDENHS